MKFFSQSINPTNLPCQTKLSSWWTVVNTERGAFSAQEARSLERTMFVLSYHLHVYCCSGTYNSMLIFFVPYSLLCTNSDALFKSLFNEIGNQITLHRTQTTINISVLCLMSQRTRSRPSSRSPEHKLDMGNNGCGTSLL